MGCRVNIQEESVDLMAAGRESEAGILRRAITNSEGATNHRRRLQPRPIWRPYQSASTAPHHVTSS